MNPIDPIQTAHPTGNDPPVALSTIGKIIARRRESGAFNVPPQVETICDRAWKAAYISACDDIGADLIRMLNTETERRQSHDRE